MASAQTNNSEKLIDKMCLIKMKISCHKPMERHKNKWEGCGCSSWGIDYHESLNFLLFVVLNHKLQYSKTHLNVLEFPSRIQICTKKFRHQWH